MCTSANMIFVSEVYAYGLKVMLMGSFIVHFG